MKCQRFYVVMQQLVYMTCMPKGYFFILLPPFLLICWWRIESQMVLELLRVSGSDPHTECMCTAPGSLGA